MGEEGWYLKEMVGIDDVWSWLTHGGAACMCRGQALAIRCRWCAYSGT